MKRLLQPEQEEAQPERVVVVNTLTPEYGALYLTDYDGYEAGTIRPIVGGNLTEETDYLLPGIMPKDFRHCVENEDYGSEILFQPLPSLIDEMCLKDYKKDGKQIIVRVITNCMVIQKPKPAAFKEPDCVVRQHPAALAFERLNPKGFKKQTKKAPPILKDPNQYTFPFAQNDVKPIINKTA